MAHIQAIGTDRFGYDDSVGDPTFADLAAQTKVRPGLTGACPKCEITLLCVGPTSDEAPNEVWSVSTQDRVGKGGQALPGGYPVSDSEEPR